MSKYEGLDDKQLKFILRELNINFNSAQKEAILSCLSYIKVEQEGAGSKVTWSDISGKPSTFAPEIGTTATTAKAGNYAPTWAQVSGKPTTFAPVIGTTAATAAPGTLAAEVAALAVRVTALES